VDEVVTGEVEDIAPGEVAVKEEEELSSEAVEV